MKALSISALLAILTVFPTFGAAMLVAQWDSFEGLTSANPIPPTRGASLFEKTWSFTLNGATVNPDGSLTTGTGIAPMILFNGTTHNIGGYQLSGNNAAGGYTVIMTMRPNAFNTADPRPVWSIVIGDALTYDQTGLLCSLYSETQLGVRGVWNDALWDSGAQQNFTLSGEETELTFRSSATNSGLITSLNGSGGLGWSGLKGSAYTPTAFSFGNYAGNTSGGNDFTITRLAVYQTGQNDTSVTFDDSVIPTLTATLPADTTAWENLSWDDDGVWINATPEALVGAVLTVVEESTLSIHDEIAANTLRVTGGGALIVRYDFTVDDAAQISDTSPVYAVNPLVQPFLADDGTTLTYAATAPEGYMGVVSFTNGRPVFSLMLATYTRVLTEGDQEWFTENAWMQAGQTVSYPEDETASIAYSEITVIPGSILSVAKALTATGVRFTGEGPFTFQAENTLSATELDFSDITGTVSVSLPIQQVGTIRPGSNLSLTAVDTADLTFATSVPGALAAFTKMKNSTLTVPVAFAPDQITVAEGTLKLNGGNATLIKPYTISEGAVLEWTGSGGSNRTFGPNAYITGPGTLRITGGNYIVMTRAANITGYPSLELNTTGDGNALILDADFSGKLLDIGNLTGTSTVRVDWNAGDGPRTIAAHLTKDCTFSGRFMNNGNRKASLTVSSADAADVKTLTLTGNNDTLGTLTVRPGGCVDLASNWNGPVQVEAGGTLKWRESTLRSGTFTLAGTLTGSGTVAALTADGGTICSEGLTLSALSGTGATLAYTASAEGLTPPVTLAASTTTPLTLAIEGLEELPKGKYPLVHAPAALSVVFAESEEWAVSTVKNADNSLTYVLGPRAGVAVFLW